MAISKNCSIVIQFTMIIVLSACLAGIVGGVTSQISKFKSAAVVRNESNTSGVAEGVRMVARCWVA